MIYQAFQAQEDLSDPVRIVAGAMAEQLNRPGGPFGGLWRDTAVARSWAATLALISHLRLSAERPSFGIGKVVVGNREIEVIEEPALKTPFGTLLHFKKDISGSQPRVLLVAPLSGHFATLLKNTVATLLPDHDVYITDWHNARHVPKSAGRFGFEDYVDHLIRFLEVIGPGAHMVAVCQPCVTALAAVAHMAEAGHPAEPASLTLMAGPIDTRINPTKVNSLATNRPIGWFEEHVIGVVPGRYEGAGRRVYPGFVQLSAFMSMNLERHVNAHRAMHRHLREGEPDKAKATKDFYDEYFSVLDLPAEFYLETVKRVFQDCDLPRGTLSFKGRPVDPGAIRKTALLTVEGERDDICALGQTLAAQELCPTIKPYRKRHHMQPGVGHYGVFSGGKWQHQIYPILRSVIQAND
jgi:poly(3-hydroxybutyrate) depolymerase